MHTEFNFGIERYRGPFPDRGAATHLPGRWENGLVIEQPLRVLHVNTAANSGGAARAAYRLHTGLRRLGHDSFMFVARQSSDDPTVKAFTQPMNLRERLRRRLRRERITRSFARYRRSRPAGYESFHDDRTQHGATPLGQLPSCDVVNLHWVAGFVDCQTFLTQVAQHTPIIWTLHDMNPFTGGCHYDDACGRYRARCGACPQLGGNAEGDLSRRVLERKRMALQEIAADRLHIVTPSRWLAEEAGRSTLLGRFSISVIPNGLDTGIFVPRERDVARAALGIPQNAHVVLFVSDSTVNRRKGFPLLNQALAGLSDLTNPFLISLGRGAPRLEAPISHAHLGHIGNDRLLALVYSAADLFVIPSLQDNLPNTVLESFACGTPVVGFNTGGIPDMVRSGVTGMLAEAENTEALRDAIAKLLQNPAKRAEMSANCRRVAVEEYALEVQARRYVELYEAMIDGGRSNGSCSGSPTER